MPTGHLNIEVSTNLHKVPAAKIQFLPEDRLWIAERIQEVLSTGQLTLGRYGTTFEEQFAAFCGTKYAIAVNSGTSALEIILRCLDVNGKDVLIPTNTFFATAAAVIHAGGRPVFVDMDPESFGMCPEDLERKLTTKSVGLILVHIGGIVSHRLPEILDALADDDVLVLTADHGNDPTTPSTDHSREYVPILITGTPVQRGINIGVRETFADLAATIADILNVKPPSGGTSFKTMIVA